MNYQKNNSPIENETFAEYRIQQKKITKAIEILKQNNYIVYKKK
jgi:hypothetical protein